MQLRPIIAPEVFALRPDFAAVSLMVTGARNAPSDGASAASLAKAVTGLAAAPWAEAHLEAWREAYRGFGAKPKRTPCSAEALRKRALKDGLLRPLNAVVDLYNAVSLQYAIPVGGEDAAGYDGQPRLCRALGDERFVTMAAGQPVVEAPDPGEVIWRDDSGVTCRRWNWRQDPRTQITEASRDMWFVLERLEPMPLVALAEAGQALVDGLRCLAPGLSVAARQFDAANPLGQALPSIR